MDYPRRNCAELKVNLFPRVPIYVADEGLPAVFRVSRQCHFYFCFAAGGEKRNEDRSTGSGSLSSATERETARHRLPPVSLFPALFQTRSSYYSSFNRGRDGFFAPRRFYRRHERALAWLILREDVCYRNRQRKGEREKDFVISDPFVRGGGCGDDGCESKISISRRW